MATMIPERRPEWLRVRPPKGENYENLKQLMRMSLYEAIVAHAPQAVGYLALPPGATAIVGKARPVIRVDNKELAFLPGSYLATRYKAISS